MKTLQSYLMRQMLATLGMTVGVFTFVLLLVNVLKEILMLLMNGQATLWGLMQAFGLLIPFVLVFALPMGMLTAALLVFGRFSADQELTATRASGVSLVALVTPILLLSLVLCGVSAWINMDLAPRCRVAYRGLVQSMGLKAGAALLPEGRDTTIVASDGSVISIFVTKLDGQELHDVIVQRLDRETSLEMKLRAPRGRLEITDDGASLLLQQPRGVQRVKDEQWHAVSSAELGVPLNFKKSDTPAAKISDMTFTELKAELRKLENVYSLPTAPDATINQLRIWKSILEENKVDVTMPVRVQIHRQVSFSFACFGFTLIGIPLGIRAHRRETNIGFALALALVFFYYSFVILGLSLQTHAEWAPYLIIWAPNFIFQVVGAVMLWRANKGI